MKIHTDKITINDLHRLSPAGVYVEATQHGSRSHDHAFKVGLSAEHGTDAHGIKRSFARNSGQFGGSGNYDRAATYIEWGDWMVELFKIDPLAVIGQYKGASHFVEATTEAAQWRSERESAVKHADRWRDELAITLTKMPR
jgi:hypothetical protein